MSIGGLLLAAGLSVAFGSTSAVVLLPFVVVRRLSQPDRAGSWWAPVLVAGFLVVSGGDDPVLLSSCGLLLAADLARQQPDVPPESLVAAAMLMTAWLAPSELPSLEAVTMVMLLAGMSASSSPFATSVRSVWGGVLLGLSCGLLIAELWVHFFPLG